MINDMHVKFSNGAHNNLFLSMRFWRGKMHSTLQFVLMHGKISIAYFNNTKTHNESNNKKIISLINDNYYLYDNTL